MRIVLLVVLICLLLEFVVMFTKHHFVTILALLQAASIFLIGHFDQYSIWLNLILNSLSFATELIWLLVMAPYMFKPPNLSHRSHSGFLLIFCFFATIIIMVGQLFVLYNFFPYRNSTKHEKFTVRLFGFVFRLDGATKSYISINLHQMED